MKRLHHVGILTSNIEETLRHYADIFGFEIPRVVGVDKPGLKLKSAMVMVGGASGNCLQLIEPIEGPGVEELKNRGEGALFEIALEVEDIERFGERITKMGITLLDFMGHPIRDKYLVAASGNKYFYLPSDKTRGTKVEVIEVVSKKG